MTFAFRPAVFLLTLSALSACSEPASDPDQPATREIAPEALAEPEVDAVARNIEITLGSAVKRLCSSVLVGGRSIDHVMANELANPVLEEVDFSFDNDLVTATGMDQSVSALYRKELGCTLVKDTTVEQLRAQFDANTYPYRPILPGRVSTASRSG